MADTFSPAYSRLLVLHNVPLALRNSDRLLDYLQGAVGFSVKVLRWHDDLTALLQFPTTALATEAAGQLEGAAKLSEAFRKAHEATHPALPAAGGASGAGVRPTTDSSVAQRLIKGALGPQRHKMGAAARTDPASTGAGYLRPNAPLPPSSTASQFAAWRSGGDSSSSSSSSSSSGGAEEREQAAPAARGRGEAQWRGSGAGPHGAAEAPSAAPQASQQHRLVERGSGPSMASTLKTIALGWGQQPGQVTAAPPQRTGAVSERVSKALSTAAAAAAAAAAEAASRGAAAPREQPVSQPKPLGSLEEEEAEFGWADKADEEDALTQQASRNGGRASSSSSSSSSSGSGGSAPAPGRVPLASKLRRPLSMVAAFVPGQAAGAGGAPAPGQSSAGWEKNPQAREFVPSWEAGGSGAGSAAGSEAAGAYAQQQYVQGYPVQGIEQFGGPVMYSPAPYPVYYVPQ